MGWRGVCYEGPAVNLSDAAIFWRLIMKKLVSTLAGLGLLASVGAAQAVPSFVVPGGQVVDPFTAIDWSLNGTAYTTNFDQGLAAAGTPFSFTTTYFSYAVEVVGIKRNSGLSANVPNLTSGDLGGGGANPFELTIYATIVETAVCSFGGASCAFIVTGGSFDIYLDTTPDAVTGASALASQYTDGVSLIGGVITGGTGSFTTIGADANTGSNGFVGVVTSTNNTYINPNLLGTRAGAEIKYGNAITGWDRPTGIVGADTCLNNPAPVGNCSLAFQADGNQSFSIVPEPGSLALLGAIAVAAGAVTRRRKV